VSHIHFFWKWLANEILSFSSLKDEEYICLVADFTSNSTNQEEKKSKLKERGYTPEQLAHVEKRNAEKFTPIVSGGLRFTKPFDHLKFEPLSYVLILYEAYERGCLPFPGSVSEQPAWIMDVFSVLQKLKLEAEQRAFGEMNNRGRHFSKNQHRNR
jgi:hypothetical protein